MRKGKFSYNSERVNMAAQDQALHTNGIRHLIGPANSDSYRLVERHKKALIIYYLDVKY